MGQKAAAASITVHSAAEVDAALHAEGRDPHRQADDEELGRPHGRHDDAHAEVGLHDEQRQHCPQDHDRSTHPPATGSGDAQRSPQGR